MLSDDELRRRLIAARTLRGLTQTDLGELLKQDGLGKHDPGRIERGGLTMQRAHREAFAHHLGVPTTWFTEPDVDVIVGLAPRPEISPGTLRGILEQALAEIDRASDQAPPEATPAPGGIDHRRRARGAAGG